MSGAKTENSTSPEFGDHCRGLDAGKCYEAFRERAKDEGITVMTVEHLAVIIGRSPRYTRSVLKGYPKVFRVEAHAALRRDDHVELV